MTISGFVAYVKQLWKNKPDRSTPITAERLLHIEEGIKGNSDAIEKIAAAVISQIINDPEKIASMAALFAVNQKVTQQGEQLAKLNSDLESTNENVDAVEQKLKAEQFSGDINDLRNQLLNISGQRIYLINKDSTQNSPDKMVGNGMLTIKNVGLFTAMDVIDSLGIQYNWCGWNSSEVTSTGWK